MKTSSCPECKKKALVKKEGDFETIYTDRHGQTHKLIVPDLSWLECSKCGEVILDTKSVSAMDIARRRALGLLVPEDIRGLRLRLGKTQTAMSELLGIGEKTYCRWESGAYVQSEASDRYLRLLLASSENIMLLQKISETKFLPKESLDSEKIRERFQYIKNVNHVLDAAKPFVEMLMHGALQSV
jgi:putative zinc finger/helix-turn-helix YgiT family protein